MKHKVIGYCWAKLSWQYYRGVLQPCNSEGVTNRLILLYYIKNIVHNFLPSNGKQTKQKQTNKQVHKQKFFKLHIEKYLFNPIKSALVYYAVKLKGTTLQINDHIYVGSRFLYWTKYLRMDQVKFVEEQTV